MYTICPGLRHSGECQKMKLKLLLDKACQKHGYLDNWYKSSNYKEMPDFAARTRRRIEIETGKTEE